jgi:hypothetical protein
MAVKLIISEYNILWAAMKHYEQHLEQVAATTDDEDKQLDVNEDLMKMEYMFKNIKRSAKEDWQMELE